jgi:pimeloyl-ACP methyl ester carboxylesterase
MLLTNPEHHYLQTNGITLHVVQSGPEEGDTVILLHGFPEFWYGWRHQIPFLAEAGYRVWVPDQRGYNLSERPRALEAYNLDELAADIAGLARASGQEQIHLVGHDWGAAVAWWVALKYPQLLKKLVILNVPHPIVMGRYLRQHPRQMLKSWYIAFFQLPWLPERVLSEDDFEVGVEMLKATSRQGSFTEEDLAQYRRAWGRPRALTGMINWYRALRRTKTARLESLKVKVPTLILWGRHDVALEEEMAHLSLELCEIGQLEIFPEATHWVQHDEPHRINRMIAAFLAAPAPA